MFALKSVDFSSLHWDFMMGNLRKQVGSQPKPPLNNSPPQFPCCSQAWMCFILYLCLMLQVLIFCQYINTLDMLEARCLETATVQFGLFPLPSLIGNMFGGWVDM